MLQAITKSYEDTQALGAALAQCVASRDIVMLVGGMGSGKTALTKGFGAALGIDEPITSPTFVLMRSYAGRLYLHHVDIYRLEHLQEVIDLGLIELLDDGGVALVEWGDLATPVLPRDFLEVRLSIDDQDDDRRHVTLTCVGQAWATRRRALAEVLQPWLIDDVGVQS